MKKTIAVIAVLMVVMLLLAGCDILNALTVTG